MKGFNLHIEDSFIHTVCLMWVVY